MASTDAKAIPIKNAAYRVTFPILDADGDLVTGATGLDSEVSIDGAAFADVTAEATEIATSSGMYFLDLTAAEMNGDTIAIIVKTTSSGAKTTPLVLYTAARSVNDLAFPAVSGRSLAVNAAGLASADVVDVAGAAVNTGSAQLGVNVVNVGGSVVVATAGLLAANVTQLSGDAVAADNAEAFFDGTGYAGTGNTIPTVTTTTNVTTVNGLAAGVITATSVATGAIDADALAADAVAEIADGVWDEARAGHVGAGSFGEGVASVQGNVTGSVGSVTGAVGSVTGAVGSVTGAVGSVTGNVGGNVVGSVGSVTAGVTVTTNSDKTGYALSAAGVDAILDDALTEPAGVFAWGTATLRNVLAWLGALSSNEIRQTSTLQTLRNRADTATIATAVVSDDATTFTRDSFT